MKKQLAICLGLGLISSAPQAQFLANAFFFQPPMSMMGTVTNNLAITNFPTHFTVTGQVIVNVPAGAQSGVLVSWEILRLLDPNWGSSTLYTGTQLIGFSQPPAGGSFATTYGTSVTEVTSLPGVSTSVAPMTLTNGVANWGVIYGSFPFTYVAGGTQFVRQRFVLDGDQLSGPGGNWVIDVPLDSYLTTTPIPEPSALLLLGAGAMLVLARQRRVASFWG